MKALRTGLIVEIVEADSAVAEYRLRLDPVAILGVPAHVTVLFPFAPLSEVEDVVLTRLRKLTAGVSPFTFELIEVGWFGEDVFWLGPDQRGADAFRDLTAAVCSTFPSYQPYGGAFADVIPRLTVGDHGAREQMVAAAAAVSGKLPINARADRLTLMAEREDGRWSVATRLTLGVPV